jgi:hypothetical protein
MSDSGPMLQTYPPLRNFYTAHKNVDRDIHMNN